MSTLNPDVIPWEVGGPAAALLWAAVLLPHVARYLRARRTARKARPMRFTTAQALVDVDAVQAALRERYGAEEADLLGTSGPLPGESRAAWKDRTFAYHYGAGTARLVDLIERPA